jgi:hypothetical protein
MTKRAHETASWTRKLALVGATAVSSLLLPALAVAAGQPVLPPVIPGAPGVPGWGAPAFKPASDLGILKAAPDSGSVGTKFTLSGSGLPANKDVSIVWATTNVTWILDARPDSVDYLGRKSDAVNVLLAKRTTDAAGAFSLELRAPRDFGGAPHDIYAVIDGVAYAKGGFMIQRKITLHPTSGPIGTPITVKITGLGASLYGSSGNIYYDGRYSGVITGVWNRGEAEVKIRAAGPVGKHTILVGGGMQFNYLNIQQSPVPWATSALFPFNVTKDAGSPPASIDWPETVTPTIEAKTTLSAASLAGGTGTATALFSSTSGAVLSKVDVSATGLNANEPVELLWSTVVGNRVNCTGTCWAFASIPLGKATAAADGSAKSSFTVPDGLGGWHVVQLLQGGKVKAQVPYYVKRSLVSVPKTVKAGTAFEVHLKGVGWTQLDNTVAVTYDNGYVGYGCGFNSDGDVVLNLVATGGPGTHLIDIYPLLYTYQPAYPYPPHGAIPFLSFARDFPGLALGYDLPAFRLAITVVE